MTSVPPLQTLVEQATLNYLNIDWTNLSTHAFQSADPSPNSPLYLLKGKNNMSMHINAVRFVLKNTMEDQFVAEIYQMDTT